MTLGLAFASDDRTWAVVAADDAAWRATFVNGEPRPVRASGVEDKLLPLGAYGWLVSSGTTFAGPIVAAELRGCAGDPRRLAAGLAVAMPSVQRVLASCAPDARQYFHNPAHGMLLAIGRDPTMGRTWCVRLNWITGSVELRPGVLMVEPPGVDHAATPAMLRALDRRVTRCSSAVDAAPHLADFHEELRARWPDAAVGDRLWVAGVGPGGPQRLGDWSTHTTEVLK